MDKSFGIKSIYTTCKLLSGVLTAGLRPAEFYTSALVGAVKRDPDRITFSEANSRLIGTIAGIIDALKVGTKAFFKPESVVDPMTKLELRKQNLYLELLEKLLDYQEDYW